MNRESILSNDTADAEMELNSADLLALANPLPTPSAAEQTSAQSIPPMNRGKRNATASPSARIAITLCAVLTLASASYGLAEWRKTTASLTSSLSHNASVPDPISQPDVAESVKFANPFDPQEVFEFRSGTSPEAAREAVAEILRKRAMDRQPG